MARAAGPAKQGKLTPFLLAVRRTIRGIPRGQTMSYGGVAEACGVPRGARAVVRALRVLDDVPWWRVRRADGSFAPQCLPMQETLLRQEGWRPAAKKRRSAGGKRSTGGSGKKRSADKKRGAARKSD